MTWPWLHISEVSKSNPNVYDFRGHSIFFSVFLTFHFEMISDLPKKVTKIVQRGLFGLHSAFPNNNILCNCSTANQEVNIDVELVTNLQTLFTSPVVPLTCHVS